MDVGNLISGSSSFSVLSTFCLFSSVPLPFVTLFSKYLLNIYFWSGTVYISRSLCPPAACDLVMYTCMQVKSVKTGLLSSSMAVYGGPDNKIWEGRLGRLLKENNKSTIMGMMRICKTVFRRDWDYGANTSYWDTLCTLPLNSGISDIELIAWKKPWWKTTFCLLWDKQKPDHKIANKPQNATKYLT